MCWWCRRYVQYTHARARLNIVFLQSSLLTHELQQCKSHKHAHTPNLSLFLSFPSFVLPFFHVMLHLMFSISYGAIFLILSKLRFKKWVSVKFVILDIFEFPDLPFFLSLTLIAFCFLIFSAPMHTVANQKWWRKMYAIRSTLFLRPAKFVFVVVELMDRKTNPSVSILLVFIRTIAGKSVRSIAFGLSTVNFSLISISEDMCNILSVIMIDTSARAPKYLFNLNLFSALLDFIGRFGQISQQQKNSKKFMEN